MKAPLAALLACALAAPALAAPKIPLENLDYRGEKRPYALYVPADLPAGPVPLLLTFHGSGRDGKSLVEKWTKLADRHKLIVAGLHSKDPQGWLIPVDGPDLQKALVEACGAGTRSIRAGSTSSATRPAPRSPSSSA